MKNIGKYLGVLAGFMLLILIFLYNNSAIGTYKTNVEKDARVSQRIPDDWQVAKAETKRILRSLERNRFPWFTKILHESMADFLPSCPVFPAEQIKIFLFLHLYGFRAIGQGSGKNLY